MPLTPTSYIAINRVVEAKMARDPEYRKNIERMGKAVLSTGRSLSTKQLVARLRPLHVVLDRDAFADLCSAFCSAEELSQSLVQSKRARLSIDLDEDWLWICLAVLWERWYPDVPSMEILDDRIQRGYEHRQQQDLQAAFEIWSRAWKDVQDLARRFDLGSISKFDDRFGGTRAVSTWVRDLVELCRQTDRAKEARELEAQIEALCADAPAESSDVSVPGNVLRRKRTVDFGDPGLPLEHLPNLADALRSGDPVVPGDAKRRKARRNDPCPCGSGRKFKKCCGAP